ncbi:MAG: hypothetical protein ACE5JI_20640 [Acidobacteriota bacterium]
MAQFLPFTLLGVALVALVVWLVLKNRASSATRAQQLSRMGFTPCLAEAQALAEKIEWLENNSEYRYSVENPMRASLDGKTVYYYRKSRRRQGRIVSMEEFLVPLKRPSGDGLMLFVKPSALPTGAATNLIGGMATAGWDSQPDDLTKLEIPIDLRRSNVIGVLGPAGVSLYNLVDAGTLARMQQVGDCGAPIVTCRGEWCSLTSPGFRMPLNLDKMWAVIRDLA